MPSYVTIELIGHTGGEAKEIKGGASFSVAVSNRFTRDGEQVEETTWFRVLQFGDSAQYTLEHLYKGALVHVTGYRIDASTWETKEGEMRVDLTVFARLVQVLGKEESYMREEPF